MWATGKNEVLCEACKTLADFLKYECRQRSFQLALANELKQICDVVPGRYATQCDNFVDQYVPYAVQMIVQELNPRTVSPELHMCPARNQFVEQTEEIEANAIAEPDAIDEIEEVVAEEAEVDDDDDILQGILEDEE